MSEMRLEAPDADSAEQSQNVVPEPGEDEEIPVAAQVPLEANEADAAEQDQALDLGDDEYR
jgi:hypothetical protein